MKGDKMAQIFNTAVLTDSGNALLTKAHAGEAELRFTAIVAGDGTYTDKTPEYLKTLTALRNQKQSFGISDKEIIEDTSVEVTATLTNEELEAGYYLNEIGLLAQDGDDASTSTLFSIAVVAGAQGDYFPPFAAAGLVEIIQNFIIATSNTANITVAIGSDVYALASDLEAHEKSPIKSNNGTHGLRYKNDTFQVYDGVLETWKDADVAKGSELTTHAESSVNTEDGVHGLRFYDEKLEYYNTDDEQWEEISTGGTTIVQIPSVVIDTYTYDGTAQGPTITGFDATHCTITGDYEATNVGSYTFTIKLNDPTKMIWSDMTTSDKTYTWSIEKMSITIPSVSVGTYTYNGNAQGPTITNLDTDHITTTGATATNAGSYTLRFALNDSSVMKWSDGTTQDKTNAYSIDKASLVIPTVTDTSFTYDGTAKHPTITGYDEDTMSRTGYENTNAGSYTLSITLDDTANYKWSDNTITAKDTAWTIAKATGSVTLSKSSTELKPDTLTDTVTVSGATGAVSVSSSDTSVCTASLSGSTITLSSVNNTSGTATITVSVAASANYEATTATISVTCKFTSIYGASWDGTSTTAWTRTDDAASFTDPVPYVPGAQSYGSPFDSLMPWSGMEKEERTGGTMVKIPKFWYKITQTGNGLKVQIADGEADGFKVSPAHMDRGDGKGERDYVYIGRYHCGATACKSASGQKPKANITRSNARTTIHNLGANIWQADFALRFTIWLLYIVEFADWNSQAKIGYGCGNNSATQNMGYTDSMPYHTGTTQTSRTTYGLGTQYRYIEGLWDNVYDWCDGGYYNSNGLNLILNPASYSDSSGGTSVGTPSSGYPSKFTLKDVSGTFQMFIPTEASGSDATYSCDNWGFSSSSPCLFVGGDYNQSLNHGLFFVSYASTSISVADRGCRLQELP